MYVLVRRDLSVPQQAVQSAHAVWEAAKTFDAVEHPSVILCGVKTEQSLWNARNYLSNAGIKFCDFTEPDIGDQLTAIATEPVAGDSVRRYFKKFQLLKGEC